ncbi:MAG: mechanosensitive ion channel [Deltaproteobacteria bacterium]|nr:mechanosensitive ion channel [Deltaproteobacteria bacterium]
MNSYLNLDLFLKKLLGLKYWIVSNVFIWENLVHLLVQGGVLLGAWIVGTLLGRWVRKIINVRIKDSNLKSKHASGFLSRFIGLLPLIFTVFVVWLCIQGVEGIGYKTFLMELVLNLAIAWIIIQLATSVILDRLWSKIIALVCWLLAALNIIGFLDRTVSLLESIGFTVGDVKLTLLSIIKAVVVLFILLRGVKWASVKLERKLSSVSELTPSARLMLTKSLNITMIVVVTLVALNSVGIDLSALAFFGGAVGVGVGFGLQKIVGNFVSGIILLSDKSIKPGDVIQIADMYGWVKHMGGRYVSMVTRDEKEILIPNENLITQEVINWSYSSRKIRIKIPVGISYNADPHQAVMLLEEAADGIERVLNDPGPKCRLVGFGDNSVDLQLRFWIRDPQNGVANITSEVMLKIWDTLKAHKIEIPFPQRDVHLDNEKPIQVVHVTEQKNPPAS